MPANERAISEVLQDIIRNIQDIVRSEVRLAKTEVREEAFKAKSAGLLLGAGALTAIFATGFLLLTIVYALATVMPPWAAALAVAAITGLIAAGLLSAGRSNLKQIHASPQRTVETLKENVEWMRQQTK